jgi:recombination protein RecA
VIDLGVANNVVEKSGAWFSYKGERLGQGRENSKQTLKNDTELRGRIEREVRLKLGIPVPQTEEERAESKAEKADKSDKSEKAEKAEKAEPATSGKK